MSETRKNAIDRNAQGDAMKTTIYLPRIKRDRTYTKRLYPVVVEVVSEDLGVRQHAFCGWTVYRLSSQERIGVVARKCDAINFETR